MRQPGVQLAYVWGAAAAAHRRGRVDHVEQLLYPDGLSSHAAAHRLVGLAFVGTVMCADALATANGHEIGKVPPSCQYGVERDDPLKEPSAHERIIADALVSAVHGQWDRLADLIGAYVGHVPGMGERAADLLLHLLRLQCDLDAARTERRPG